MAPSHMEQPCHRVHRVAGHLSLVVKLCFKLATDRASALNSAFACICNMHAIHGVCILPNK